MASEVYFSNNPVDWVALEGLYISEKKPPGFIRGVDLSVVMFVGRCVRGPDTYQEITSPQRFIDVFGGRDYTSNGAGGTRIGEVHAALLNKQFGRIFVLRVRPAAAVKATVNLSDAVPTAIVRVDASSVGIWANGATGGVTVAVEAATDGNVNHWNCRAKYLGKEYLFENLDTTTGNDNLLATLGDDVANVITITKLASGRPVNVGDTNLAGGTEPALASTDYTNALTVAANVKGAAFVLIPESTNLTVTNGTQTTVNGQIVSLAATVKDRVFLTWSGVISQTAAQAVTSIGTDITTRSDRIVYCYNTPKTNDPDTNTKIDQGPHIWLASICSQTHPSVHKGAHETASLLAGVSSVANPGLTRNDLISLKNAGITTLEDLGDDGFLFRSVVTTSLQPGLTELSRRLMTDFLQLSAASRLKSFPKSKNTKKQQALEIAELTAFSRELQEEGDGKTIDDDDDTLGPGFLVDKKTVNTGAQRAKGVEMTLWKVRLVNHELYLVLQTEVGTGVVTVQQ